jgi:hypothetical protein
MLKYFFEFKDFLLNIKMASEIFIIFISKYSSFCQQISPQLEFIAPHFNTKVIDIDNPKTRNVMKNASKNKITSVPSAIVINTQTGMSDVYQGQKFIELLRQGVGMVQQKMEIQKKQEEQLQMQQQQQLQQQSRRVVQPIEEVTRENFNDGRHSSLDQLMEEEEEEEKLPPRRKKIGKAVIMPDKSFSPIEEQESVEQPPDIDRHASYPPRMEYPETEDGHLTKAQDRKQKLVATGKGKKVQFIEDVTEIEENQEGESVQGMTMEEILGESNGAGAGRSKESQARSSSLRKSADDLMAERDMIVKSEDNGRKVRSMA